GSSGPSARTPRRPRPSSRWEAPQRGRPSHRGRCAPRTRTRARTRPPPGGGGPMDEPVAERGVLKTVEAAGDVRVERVLVGVISARDVSLDRAASGPVAASGTVTITNGGGGAGVA